MRPERLRMSGFTAFRREADLDFSNADLFVLTGPTGSGKTSILDAICFALYGTIPRLDRRQVEPVIGLGAAEARVLFEFTVDGRRYQVGRVARRTKTGATTPEARLSGGRFVGPDEVTGASEVTKAVEELLGLSFEHFTKAVLLPQGAFASFLHDQPRERQALIESLLDMDVYDRMRESALRRREQAVGQVGELENALLELQDATEEGERLVEQRLQRVAALRHQVEAARLDERTRRIDDLRREVQRLDLQLEALAEVEIPKGLVELDLRRERAEADRRAAVEEEGRLAELVEALEERLADLPPVDLLGDTIRRHQELERLENERKLAAAELAGEEKAAAEAEKNRVEAEKAAVEAERRMKEVNEAHLAHTLALTLRQGEPCPVCGRPVSDLPRLESPGDLVEAGRSLEEARRRLKEAEQAVGRIVGGLQRLTGEIGKLDERIARLQAELAEALPPDRAVGLKKERAELEARLDEARAAHREALRRARGAASTLRDLEDEGLAFRRSLDSLRGRLAGLGLEPPPLSMRNQLEDWEATRVWAEEEARRLVARRSETKREIDVLVAELEGSRSALMERLREEGLPAADTDDLREICLLAESEARQDLARFRERRARREEAERRIEELRIEAELANQLARHLQADGFKRWLVEEALVGLAEGANRILAELAHGAYSLVVEEGSFSVVDHRNADEIRSARTLSGGETFLVSLALALALAEQLATMALGTTRIESVFLDEGFGTLDGETLEEVVAVIHELAASGRTVGLVTHVKELAEQIPVRFEVRKGPDGAVVERVEAT